MRSIPDNADISYGDVIKKGNGNLVMLDENEDPVELTADGQFVRRYLGNIVSIGEAARILGKRASSIQYYIRNGQNPDYSGPARIPPEAVHNTGEGDGLSDERHRFIEAWAIDDLKVWLEGKS